MSRYIFQKSLTSGLPSAIAVTFGAAIVSTGLLASLTSNAQTPIPSTAPSTVPSTVPTTLPSTVPGLPGGSTMPAGGSMTKPVPTGTMSPDSKPATGTPAGTAPGQKPTKKAATKTIVELASGNKSFTTLVKALKAAELVDTLAGEGPFTVFAPTNEAFAKLPKATLAKLLKPENKEQLKKILTYHVVSGVVTSQMLKAGQIETLEGSKITVKIKKGSKAPIVTLNNATIKAGAKATNGMIYAIDTVIMPAAK
jgi:uncharacterized surface protein with fasciclin (FAS1) repeats